MNRLLLLLFTFLIYSLSGIFGKLASQQPLLSFHFILYYGLELFVIALYAVLWQIVLKRMALNMAFMCKSITVVFALIFAHYLFFETITIGNLIGSALIITGIIILGYNK